MKLLKNNNLRMGGGLPLYTCCFIQALKRKIFRIGIDARSLEKSGILSAKAYVKTLRPIVY